MVSRRYSGYLADDESLRRPQVRNLSSSPKRTSIDWRNLLRPPSCCKLQDQDTASSASALSSPTRRNEQKSKRDDSLSRERRQAANEFSEFVDFLADEEVLDSLQNIVEDAVRKLCKVTTEEGEHLFDLQEESSSSPDSAAWSLSYSHRHGESSSARSRSKYTTTTLTTTTTATSSSEDDWGRQLQCKRELQPDGKVCLLDKYAARIPKLEKTVDGVSGGFHAEMFSERSGDNYYFREEHFHAWAKLAESFRQAPRKDYFSKFRKEVPAQTFSAESLHKEITNVLKRPTPSSLLLYYPGRQPFEALDFLEENKILAALQDIINQAVHKVLEATSLTDGLPLFSIFDEQGHPVPWDSSAEGSEEEERDERDERDEGSGSDVSGSGEGESSEGDSKSDGGTSVDGKKKKKKKKKGRRKKKKEGSAEEEKGKQKYTPPPLPKSKRKPGAPEEPQRKPKYVAPPLPKTKPRPPPEEPAPKPKYVPPPLPKPRQKKQDLAAQAETEAQQKQKTLAKHIITTKDIKRARLEARPAPKQAVIDFLIENAAKLILYKYNYETLLSEKLGFISVPVTKVLLEIMFGYKKIKGSGIRLSSQIDWSRVYEEIYAPRPPRPKTPKRKGEDKKKAGGKKKAGDKKKTTTAGGKRTAMKSPFPMPSGKVVVTKTQIKSEVEYSKTEGREFTPEHDVGEGPEIFEIVPPQFPEDSSERADDFAEEESENQPSTPKERLTPTDGSSTKLDGGPPGSEETLPSIPTKQSSSHQRPNVAHSSNKGSTSVLPEVEPTGQSSGELLKKVSSSRRASMGGEASKRSSTTLPKI